MPSSPQSIVPSPKSRSKGMSLAIAIVLVLPCLVPAAQGQTSGTLEGTVTLAGRPLPAARVTIASPAMQGTRAAETDVNGRYRFDDIPPGDYTVGFIAGDLHITRTA